MPYTVNVTPVRAVVSYDDYENQWYLHASKLEYSARGDHREVIKEHFDTFADLLVLLLKIWLIAGPAAGDAAINAPIGDLSVIGAAITAGPLGAEGTIPTYPRVDDVGDAVPPEDYDGAGDDWGQTPAGP